MASPERPTRSRRVTRHSPDGSEVPLDSRKGLTLHVEESPHTQRDIHRLLAGLNRAKAILKTYEKFAKKKLRDAGLPSRIGVYLVRADGSVGRKARAAEEFAAPEFQSLTWIVKNRVHAPEWWAVKILNAAAACRSAIDQKDAERAAVAMAAVVEFGLKAAFKGGWEAAAIRGEADLTAVRRGAEKGRESQAHAAAENRERWRRRARRLWAAHPLLSIRAVASQIAGPDEKVNTIRKAIAAEKPRPKK